VCCCFARSGSLGTAAARPAALCWSAARAGAPARSRVGQFVQCIAGPFSRTVQAVSLVVDLAQPAHTAPVPVDRPSRMAQAAQLERRISTQGMAAPDFVDRALQNSFGALAMPAPSLNFAGLGLQLLGVGLAAGYQRRRGPEHYIQIVNTSVGHLQQIRGAIGRFCPGIRSSPAPPRRANQ